MSADLVTINENRAAFPVDASEESKRKFQRRVLDTQVLSQTMLASDSKDFLLWIESVMPQMEMLSRCGGRVMDLADTYFAT
ncbi:hypothetical protein C0989_000122 [Termitomyces sp. Mn162]|nr:hypothetical protein C0989_000122 [Termitomyces sp. Mn162]